MGAPTFLPWQGKFANEPVVVCFEGFSDSTAVPIQIRVTTIEQDRILYEPKRKILAHRECRSENDSLNAAIPPSTIDSTLHLRNSYRDGKGLVLSRELAQHLEHLRNSLR